MTYQLIETYDDGDAIVVGDRRYPVQCLVEDANGMRLLLTGSFNVNVRHWRSALQAGVVALVQPWAGGWIAMSAEQFADERTESNEMMTAPNQGRWRFFPQAPGYLDIAGATQGATASQPPLESSPAHDGGEFVHLHAHTEYSNLDGLTIAEEMVAQAVAHGDIAVAVTDHGACAGHPDLQKHCLKAGIKPIFGLEAYLVDDRLVRPHPKPKPADYVITVDGVAKHDEIAFAAVLKEWEEETARIRDYYHLILWAMDDDGLRNLWAANTQANIEGHYYHPRMDWDTLAHFNAGLMCSTACLRGPLAKPLKDGGDIEKSSSNLGRLLNIFGDERLFVELHTNQQADQKRVNEQLLYMANQAGLPTIAVCDSHYACTDDMAAHKVWIASQTNKDLQDEPALFETDDAYHLMSAAEVRQALVYLPPAEVERAIANTVGVADRCNARVEGKTEAPIFTRPTAIAGYDTLDPDTLRAERIRKDVDRLVDRCLAHWDKTTGKRESQEVYEARFEREMRLLIDKGFCGYFDMVWDYVGAAKEGKIRPDGKPILVGPGRGSGGGCLVAYLSGITEIDPVEADLIFERFLTEGRTELPDFDIDFPQSQRPVLTDWVINRWGEDHVVRVGTHIRFRNKGVVRALARVLKNTIEIDYRDIDAVCKIIDEAEASSAGLGYKWDDIWEEHAEVLDPYRKKYPFLFEVADKMVGRLSAYGKHPAGIVISPDDPLTGRLPLRMAGEEGKDKQLVSEFDMDTLAELGLVKFDLLTLRNLDTIQECIDLIYDRYGTLVNVYEWREQYEDPQVWDEISDGHTLGIFQIETRSGTRLTKQFRPQSLADLSDVITLVRPGPVRSGLTETYFRRRTGVEPVSFPDPRLEHALGKTYGCIVYQEDIMNTCMVLAGYDSVHADKVRKILGKKKVEDVDAEMALFIPACVERGMIQGVVEALATQMVEFAKYSFNRAHAYAYAVIGHWTAWFKFHYPVQFLTAALSTVDKERIPEFITEARRMGYSVLPPDVNESGVGFRAGSDLRVRYGLDSVKGIGDVAAEAVMVGQPYTSFEDFMERRGAKADMGVVKTLVEVGAFDSLVPNRKALEQHFEWISSGDRERCMFKDTEAIGPNGLPCRYDWTTEPVVLGKSGKALKAKPIPKKCTKACRHYTPPPPRDHYPDVDAYTPAEIRDREMEMLGVHLSSTPFDEIPEEILLELRAASEIEMEMGGEFDIAAVVKKVRPTRDRHNNEMAFATLMVQDGDIEVTVFKDAWRKYKGLMTPGALCLAIIFKNERGHQLVTYQPL